MLVSIVRPISCPLVDCPYINRNPRVPALQLPQPQHFE